MSGQGTARVLAEFGRTLTLVSCVQLLPLTGLCQPAGKPPSATDTARQHLYSATTLERLGLLKESEAQYLAAMKTPDPALRQQAEAGLVRTHREQQEQVANTDLELGKALEESHQLNEALAAYERAFREGKDQKRATAREAVLRVLEKRESFRERYARGWVLPWLTKFAIGLLGLLALYLLLKLLYRVLRGLGRGMGSLSSRIEIADFQDTTETGLGRGFPALLRTVYWERQLLAQPPPASYGGVALAFYSSESNLPVMGSATYETFSEISLELAGVKVSELLSRMERLLFQPRYRIGGVIYRCGNEVRSAVSLSKYNRGEMSRWDFVLGQDQGGAPMLSDPMYEIIDVILRDWNA